MSFPPCKSVAADPGAPDEDAGLVAASQSGDRTALGLLLERHAGLLFSVCLRVSGSRQHAEDLAQEAALRAIAGLGSFDGRSRFRTWLARVATNTCLSARRKERLRRHASLDAPVSAVSDGIAAGSLAGLLPSVEPSPEARVQEKESLERLYAGLASLPAAQREILLFRDAQDLDYSQIAACLGVAVGTVKSRLSRARAALRLAVESSSPGGL